MIFFRLFTIDVTMPNGSTATVQTEAAAPMHAIRDVQASPQMYGLYGVSFNHKLAMRIVATSAPFCSVCYGNGVVTRSAHPDFCSDYETTCPACNGNAGTKPIYE